MVAQLTVRGGTQYRRHLRADRHGHLDVDRPPGQHHRPRPGDLPALGDAADVAAANYTFNFRTGASARRRRDLEPESLGRRHRRLHRRRQPGEPDQPGRRLRPTASSVTATAPSLHPTVANTRLATFVGPDRQRKANDNWTGLTNEPGITSSTGERRCRDSHVKDSASGDEASGRGRRPATLRRERRRGRCRQHRPVGCARSARRRTARER